MTPLSFTIFLGALLLAVLLWGFRHQTREHWQVLAVLPLRRLDDGTWRSLNFTYYGLFTASAQAFSIAMGLLLFGAAGIGRAEAAALVIALLTLCLPAAKLAAMIVERKPAGFSVGGAAFVGMVGAPWVILGVNQVVTLWQGNPLPVVPALAVMAIALAYGEGLGRLGCISFGCCYGKPLETAPTWMRRIFRNFHFVFDGTLKKIAYASNLAGEKVIPIQAITALFYTAIALVSTYLFLQNAYTMALLLSLCATQVWRIVSEVWRADYRGEGRISAYQILALVGMVYTIVILRFVPEQPLPDTLLAAGFDALWHPGAIVLLLAIWAVGFVYYGRSTVTGASLSLHVCHDRI
jgi:prolipoprotein diacylglyceryltransferase